MDQIVSEFAKLHENIKKEWWRDEEINFEQSSLESIKKLTDLSDEDIKSIYTEIVPVSVMKKKLLELEFNNMKIKTEKKMTLEIFDKQAQQIFNRYQCKAGGQLFEDYQWIVHRKGSKNYRVQENEVFYENSIPLKYATDQSTKNYLERLIKILDSLAENINVRFRDYYRDDLKWVVIKCTMK